MPIPSDFITSASVAGCMLAEPVHRPGPLPVGPPAGSSDPIADLVLHDDVRQLVIELHSPNVEEATEVAAVQAPLSPLGSSGTTDRHLPGLVGSASFVASTAR